MHRLSEFIYKDMTDGYYFDEHKIEWVESNMPGLDWILSQEYTYTYDGEIENEKMHGEGIRKCSNGDVYTGEYNGEWKNDKMHGKGKLTWNEKGQCGPNSYSYDGEWVNGKPHGEGIYKDGYGNIYEGGWKFGYRKGEGVWTTINDDRYKGKWVKWEKKHDYDAWTKLLGWKQVRILILPNTLLRYNDNDDENEDNIETNNAGTDDKDEENDDYETMEDIIDDRLGLMELLNII